MKFIKNTGLIRGFTVIIASIFIVLMYSSSLAFNNEADVNQMLGTKSYKIANKDAMEDTEYFKRKTNNLDEFMDYKLDLIERTTDEGIVLVKNDGVLPLKTEEKVTLLGVSSTHLVYNTSGGAGTIGNEGVDAINMTLKTGLENSEFEINPEMWTFNLNAPHNELSSANQTQPANYPAEAVSTIATYNDAGIVVLHRNSGEGGDVNAEGYRLSDNERELVDFAKTNFDKVILIVNSDSALEIDEFSLDVKVNAILVAGGLGARGANSIGKILRGTVNPSGRLSTIFASDSQSSPAFVTKATQKYSNSGTFDAYADENGGIHGGNQHYYIAKEGIYLGYKYYETRYNDLVTGDGENANSIKGAKKSAGGWNYESEVTYSFGYGLSYSTFTQEITKFEVKDGVVSVDVKVQNTGNTAGKEVVQLYVQTPYTAYDKTNKVEKSAVQLVNFGKTKTLAAGASETLTIKMDLYNIMSYDYVSAKTWILDDGKYYFALGNGAHDALNNILAKRGKTVADGMTYNGKASLVEEWTNNSFQIYNKPEFTDQGFTTINGLYHRDSSINVTNVLDDADLNNWLGEGTVTYLSRSDWDSTWPVEDAPITASNEMIKRLTFSYYEKGSSDTSSIKHNVNSGISIISLRGLSYDDPMWDTLLDQLSIEELINSVNKNFGAIDPILSIAFPGTNDNDAAAAGPNSRYLPKYNTGNTPFEGFSKFSDVNAKMYPSHSLEASTFNQELLYEIGECLSEDAYYVDFISLWGPGLNLQRTPFSGRNPEYFSEDPQLTYIAGAQMTAGLQSNGVVASPKHFAFNDQEQNRYGYAVYMNEQTARETSLRGFEGASSVAKAKNLMSGLNRIGVDWVGASLEVQNTILREEWGFDGYIITDNAMQQYQAGLAIVYGTDKFMLTPGNNRSNVLNRETILNDKNLLLALREANHRILYSYVNSSAMNGVSPEAVLVPATPWWKATLIVTNSVLGALSVGGLGLFVFSIFRRRIV